MSREPRIQEQAGVDLTALRADPAHWTWYGGYRCAQDPRLFVRGRFGLSWTINEAHPRANLVQFTVVFLVLAATAALLLLGPT